MVYWEMKKEVLGVWSKYLELRPFRVPRELGGGPGRASLG